MKIKCPNCKNEFDWKPPEETEVMKMILAEDISKKIEPKRYVTSCPSCKAKLSVYA